MLVFVSSDKGGTGRTVTACNVAHELTLLGLDVAYVDFDFGAPTTGAVLELPGMERGADVGGVHSYLLAAADFVQVDVRSVTSRPALRGLPPGAGRLVLVPGDRGGAEFGLGHDVARVVERTRGLFTRLLTEFDVCIVDLSSGRSTAVEIALRATFDPRLERIKTRWLVFHRWTQQHVVAASGLLFGEHGILQSAAYSGADERTFLEQVRTVRTAVPDLKANGSAYSAAQATWLQACDSQLHRLARDHHLGASILLGTTPMEQMLLWREQLILHTDVSQGFAAPETLDAFRYLAEHLVDDFRWEGMP